MSIYKSFPQTSNQFLDWLCPVVHYINCSIISKKLWRTFDLAADNKSIKDFIDPYNLIDLIKLITYLNGTGYCINILAENQKNSNAFENGLSSQHLFIYSIFKTSFQKISQLRSVANNTVIGIDLYKHRKQVLIKNLKRNENFLILYSQKMTITYFGKSVSLACNTF